MAKKGIFIAELMASTELGSLLRSVQNDDAKVENGTICKLGGLIDPEKHLYEYAAVEAITDTVYFVDGVEVIKDETITYGLDDFENKEGRPFRARKPQVGDVFSISASVVDSIGEAPEKGNFVATQADTKVKEVAEIPTTDESFVAEIEDVYVHGSRAVDMVRLVVVKA